MQQKHRWTAAVAVLIIAGLGLSACAGMSASDDSASHSEPARVESLEGTDLHRVILTEKAAERLGIQTTPVRDEQVGETSRMVIPYAAVIYDADGATWTYTNPEPLIFVRHAITVDYIEADLAILSDGPPAGTAVVIVGGAELFGTEYGVGH